MAIKERKNPTPIPSPSKIKNSPHSFSETELNELRKLREKISQLTLQFGQISISIIKLKESENQLKDQLSSLEKEETNLAKKLSDKYGDGSIDLESGTFTPSN
jgi:chromosome segregation ATPase